MLTQARLKELLFYDSGSGLFVRNVSTSPNARVGDIAGSRQNTGYLAISIGGKKYYCHRLAWLYMYGCFPSNFIDHVNQVKSDNRIENLRDVNKSINSYNTPVRSHSKVGHKNIKFDKRDGCYTVIITRNKVVHSLGRYRNLSDAISVRDINNAAFN